MGKATQQGQETSQETGRPAGRGRSPGSRRTQFPKGVSPNPGGKPKVKPEEPDGLDDAGRMRRVFEQPKERDQNSPQRHLRRALEKDTSGYFKIMLGLEKDRREARAAESEATQGVTSPPDEGEERVLALIAELLEEARQGGPPESGA